MRKFTEAKGAIHHRSFVDPRARRSERHPSCCARVESKVGWLEQDAMLIIEVGRIGTGDLYRKTKNKCARAGGAVIGPAHVGCGEKLNIEGVTPGRDGSRRNDKIRLIRRDGSVGRDKH